MFALRRIAHAKFATVLAAVVALVFAACGGNTGNEVRLQGAGATFPNPLYQKWLSEYGKLNPNVKIDYQSIGSGGGIKQIQSRTVDFGASDSPMKDEDLRAAPGPILHIPTVLGAVVITYNLAGVSQALRFTPEIIADVFLGKIKKWNDPRLKADNPGVSIPDSDITVVHRSDGSGTSAVFTDYLSKVSPEWKEKVGTGTSPNWPIGLGGKGNEGVTGQVKQTPNTIGYVELAYAAQNKLPVALVKNKAGNFVEPSIDAVTAAAAAARLSRRRRKICESLSLMQLARLHIPFQVIPTFWFTENSRIRLKGRRWSTSCGGESTTAKNLRRIYSTRRCPMRS